MKIRTAEELIADNLIVRHYSGSRAYGTSTPESDVDIRGIFHADAVNLLTPFYPVREVLVAEEEDTKYYELAHFFKLCLDCNPNIVESLWVDRNSIIETTPAYEIIRENRKLFLSTKIKHTTSGYAFAQLKRIKGHNRWINNPQPKDPPLISNYFKLVHGSGAFAKFSPLALNSFFDGVVGNGEGVAAIHVAGGTVFALAPFVREFLHKDNQLIRSEIKALPEDFLLCVFDKDGFTKAKENHKSYWYWKNNRNKKRSALEELYGFDSKHAMHLVRLFRMGMEVLETGEFQVFRKDAKELLEIRNGKWSYEQVLDYTEECDSKLNKLYKTSDLPKKPNVKKVAELLLRVQKELKVY